MINLAHNAVNAKLYGAERDAKLLVSSALSYMVNGAEFTEAFKKHRWDGRKSFFNYKDATFPAGFVDHVCKSLRSNGFEVQIVRRPLPAPQGPLNPKVDNFPNDPRYDYQAHTVDKLLQFGAMTARIATGGGKSRIAKMVYARIRRPTLFLTTRGVLLYQMKDDVEKSLNVQVGVMGDSEWTPRTGFNVGMIQTLAARLELKTYDLEIARFLENQHSKENAELTALKSKMVKANKSAKQIIEAADKLRAIHEKRRPTDRQIADLVKKNVDAHNKRRESVISVMQKFEVLILEEAHESGSDSYFAVAQSCKNANYRLGLTATPFMRDDEEDNMKLMGCCGPVGVVVSEKMLIDRGILAQPIFKYISAACPKGLFRTSPWTKAQKCGIVENSYRNDEIVFEAKRAVENGMTVMILIQRIQHGKALKKLISVNGMSVELIDGSSNQQKRKAALSKLAGGKINVLVGSTILDVGVDVPSVGMVIMAGGGKAEVAMRQRIGRGLREKKTGGNYVFVVDFNDEHNYTLKKHAKERRRVVETTRGFGESILSEFQDFDFSLINVA